MRPWTIIVEFETLGGKDEAFATLIRDHARRTRDEPGCLRFEVVRPVNRDGTPLANRFVVNELFANGRRGRARETIRAWPDGASVRASAQVASFIWATALDEARPQEGLTPDELTRRTTASAGAAARRQEAEYDQSDSGGRGRIVLCRLLHRMRLAPHQRQRLVKRSQTSS